MKRDLIARIEKANRGRDSLRLAIKYVAIGESAFRFFRGTCHLFYEDWPRKSVLDKAPKAWITGDLHLENFGSFRGSDGQVYFDLNDFDEAALAPCALEVARTVTSIHLATSELGRRLEESRALAVSFIKAYRAALASGKAGWITQASAHGPIHELLDTVCARDRAAFLDHRTRVVNGRRLFIVDGAHLLKADVDDRRRIGKLIARFAKNQPEPARFKTIDIAIRVAGTGSLGVQRFVILTQGKGSPDHNHLLDLKEALPPSIERALKLKQPRWSDEAERVVTIQQRMQAVSPPHLSALRGNRRSYVLKDLQPVEDRLDLSKFDRPGQLAEVLGDMARVTAWAHLRASGRQGSACADDLIAFGSRKAWVEPLLEYGEHYSQTVRTDWQQFRLWHAQAVKTNRKGADDVAPIVKDTAPAKPPRKPAVKKTQ